MPPPVRSVPTISALEALFAGSSAYDLKKALDVLACDRDATYTKFIDQQWQRAESEELPFESSATYREPIRARMAKCMAHAIAAGQTVSTPKADLLAYLRSAIHSHDAAVSFPSVNAIARIGTGQDMDQVRQLAAATPAYAVWFATYLAGTCTAAGTDAAQQIIDDIQDPELRATASAKKAELTNGACP